VEAADGPGTGAIELGRGWITRTLVRRRGAAPRSGAGTPFPLEPRGVGAILDTALEVLSARFGTCVGVAACLWVPALSLGRIGLRARGALEALSMVTGLAAQFVVQGLAVGLVTIVVYGHLQGRRVSGPESARIALLSTPALLATALISSLGTVGGACCCIVPGIVLSWLWMVAPAAVVLERVGPIQALARSAALAKGGFLRWAGTMLTQVALTLPVTIIGASLADPNVRAWIEPRLGLGPLAFDVLDVALSSFLMGIATALSAVVLTVFYIDCRVRKEGFDLVMRLERLRDRARPHGALEASA
jgi:hypothetical protein